MNISIFIVCYSSGNSKNTSKDVLNKILDQIFTGLFPGYTIPPPSPSQPAEYHLNMAAVKED